MTSHEFSRLIWRITTSQLAGDIMLALAGAAVMFLIVLAAAQPAMVP